MEKVETKEAEVKPDDAAAGSSAKLRSETRYPFSGHPPPSKESLKNILQRDYKIVESMATNAADAFLESLEFAGLINTAGNITPSGSAPSEKPQQEEKPRKAANPDVQTIEVPSD